MHRLRREVFGTPAETRETIQLRRRELWERQASCRRFIRHGRNLDPTPRDAVPDFQSVEAVTKTGDIGGTVNFWQDDPVWRAAHDRRKVGQRQIIQGVDPDPIW